MAVKPSYKIPASLDANHLSMEITLQNTGNRAELHSPRLFLICPPVITF